MKFYELSTIGEFHVNHNEDFLVVEELGVHRKMIAVMDGCSSGRESHFASALMGKVLRKIAKQTAFIAFARKDVSDLKTTLDEIALQLFCHLKDMNRQLDLRSDELLATLILGLIDEESASAEMIIVGDGIIHVDGESFEFDNDNKPDYIGYHLKMESEIWLQTKPKRKSITNFSDLSISTDGIFTFKNHDGKTYPEFTEAQIMHAFFADKSNMDNHNMLKKNLLMIQYEYGLKPSDDLTIIRVIKE